MDDDSSIGAIGSHISGDAASINSDELTALLSDMQVRIPEFANENSGLIKENGIIPSSSKDHVKGEEEQQRLEEDGNDTTDSGFQTSDTS
ncbi:unnamed protein product [Onchocerca flexuosa]|uniref:Structural protein n=1 Tax=Onchocerca flexuosa TaxID=387005 RepID=A0A183HPC0_9BILA|nr:unnamed protein product [Onchocerca flexuosa]